MPGYFGTGTFAELEQALIEAAKWLASRGANTSSGRIGNYLRAMRAPETQSKDKCVQGVVCEKAPA